MIVKDQVPISQHAQIKVNVLEPNLPEIQSQNQTDSSNSALKEVSISGNKEVKARWARVNDEEDISNVGASGEVNSEGILEWICALESNSSLDLKLNWEVNVPKGFKWKQY